MNTLLVDDPRIGTLFPNAVKIPDGRFQIEHTPHTSVILRSMGFQVPAAVTQQGSYDWPNGPPFDIQRHTVAHLTENNRAYVLSSMGTGKTRCVLWAFDYLRKIGAAKKMLVLCPLSTMQFVWGREVFHTVPHLEVVHLWHYKLETRLERLKQDADIYILNHDGIKLLSEELIARTDIDVLCVDELAIYRNRTDRTRTAVKLAASKHIVWGLTGAPTPNEPTDVFWQSKVVTPHTTPKFWGTLRNELMLRVNQFKWVPKRDAAEKAIGALRPNVRFRLEDVTELPDFVAQRVDVGLGPKQAMIYREMTANALAMVGQNLITAANAAAVMSKLQQIAIGWVYDSKKGIVQLDNDLRLQALINIVQGAVNKVIVLAPFKHALEGIHQALTQAGYKCSWVDGDTPPPQRDKIFHEFQSKPEPKVLPAHPACISHGLTLTAADTIVWFGPILSAETYEQANARIRRVGQRHKQLFLHLQGTPVERKLYTMLTNKVHVQDALLSILENESWDSMNRELGVT